MPFFFFIAFLWGGVIRYRYLVVRKWIFEDLAAVDGDDHSPSEVIGRKKERKAGKVNLC